MIGVTLPQVLAVIGWTLLILSCAKRGEDDGDGGKSVVLYSAILIAVVTAVARIFTSLEVAFAVIAPWATFFVHLWAGFRKATMPKEEAALREKYPQS